MVQGGRIRNFRSLNVRVGFGQNGFFADFFFGRRIFSRILSPDFFSSFLWEKVPRKILQENPRQKPPNFIQQKSPTHFCRGAGPINMLSAGHVVESACHALSSGTMRAVRPSSQSECHPALEEVRVAQLRNGQSTIRPKIITLHHVIFKN